MLKIPLNLPFQKELLIGYKAITQAAKLTQKVYKTKIESISKQDKSPVTIADYGSQAIINKYLNENFPNDQIVAEENTLELMNNEKKREITLLVNEILKTNHVENEIMRFIDLGNSEGGNKGRFWTIDPIDGTKGFIRGEQYAICLALIIDGIVTIGILNCPNLPSSTSNNNQTKTLNDDEKGNDHEKGSIFIAIKGYGAYEIIDQEFHKINVSKCNDLTKSIITESFESSHSSHNLSNEFIKLSNIIKNPIRIDSQCKYGLIARGEAEIYLRIPINNNYKEKIWDHASGCLIVSEAGGIVKDLNNKDIDFSKGKYLIENKGLIVSNKFLINLVLNNLNKVI